MVYLLTLLRSSLQNQIVGGGLVLMFTGSMIALARNTPTRILRWIRNRFTRSITIENRDPLFDYVTYWLDGQERFYKARQLKATTQLRFGSHASRAVESALQPDASRRKSLEVFFSPSEGHHFFMYQRTWISICRESKNGPSSGMGNSTGIHDFSKQEDYRVEAYSRGGIAVLKELVREIVRYGTEDTEGVRVYRSIWGNWESDGYKKLRPLSTVVLPTGVAENVLEDMRRFRSRETWYRNLGIPWHRGYLFFGLPGSGKTSLAAALAGELGMDVYVLNLAGTGMTDERLQDLIGTVRQGSMVIMEDADCTIPQRDVVDGNRRITLSGLLNCLDGITSREGCIIVMTTNRRDTLDSALLRPGRVDFEMEFGYATHDQVSRLARAIGVSDHGEWAMMTMAEVQQRLLERHENTLILSEVADSGSGMHKGCRQKVGHGFN